MFKQLWQDLFKAHVQPGSFLLRLGLAVVKQGSGKLSLDYLFFGRRNSQTS
jgi:hypothetical protein